MKRLLSFCLLTSLIFGMLCGCAKTEVPPEQPYLFYYRTDEISYGSEDGVIADEQRDMGSKSVDARLLMQEYLQGPTEKGLISPYPKGVTLEAVEQEEKGVLTICLGGTYRTLSGINASIADACITRTMLQLDGVSRVHIVVLNAQGAIAREQSLSQSDLVLFDDGSAAGDLEVTLYYADSRSRYLLAETRTIPYMDETLLPQYVVEQLIAGPKTVGLYTTIPVSTSLLDINVENGVCSVDFTADFTANKPVQELQERVMLLSIINSLTKLDSIDSVQLYVEGQLLRTYLYLDISEPLVFDSKAIGPVRPDLNETDATVFLPAHNNIALHAVPLRVKQTSNESREEALVNALVGYPTLNGLANPLPDGTQLLDASLDGSVCTLLFNGAFSKFLTQEQELSAIRSICATLTALGGVSKVHITVENGGQLPFALNAEDYTPRDDWFAAK